MNQNLKTMRRFPNDGFAWFDNWLEWSRPTFTMFKGELYNPDTHELVPRPEYRKQQLELKEDKLRELAEERKKYLSHLKEREESLQKEISELKKALSP
jgi:hypothetical protein